MFYKDHKKTFYLAVAGFSLLCILAIGPAIVQAYITISAQQAAVIQQRNDAIEAAILNNDYATWNSLVNDQGLKAEINSGNFSQFTQAYRLLQQGKVAEADIIKKSIALKQDFVVASNKSAAINDAIINNDYQSWRNIVGAGAEKKVTAGNFETYAQSYRLILGGKLKQAGYVKNRIGLKVESRFGSSR